MSKHIIQAGRGQIYRSGSGEYILAMLQNEARYDLVALISLEDGNRWRDPVRVNDNMSITTAEFNAIGGNTMKFLRHNINAE
jgi:hypothetical protein